MTKFSNEIFTAADQVNLLVAAWHTINDIENEERREIYQNVHDRLDDAPGGVLVLLTLENLNDLLTDIAEKNPVREKLAAAHAIAKQQDNEVPPLREPQ